MESSTKWNKQCALPIQEMQETLQLNKLFVKDWRFSHFNIHLDIIKCKYIDVGICILYLLVNIQICRYEHIFSVQYLILFFFHFKQFWMIILVILWYLFIAFICQCFYHYQHTLVQGFCSFSCSVVSMYLTLSKPMFYGPSSASAGWSHIHSNFEKWHDVRLPHYLSQWSGFPIIFPFWSLLSKNYCPSLPPTAVILTIKPSLHH